MKKNRIKPLISILIIFCSIIFLPACDKDNYLNPGIGAQKYYRLDLKNLEENDSVGNLRIITKDYYHFSPAKEKYSLDENYIIDETGMNTLNISGSRQFSKEQFEELAKKLNVAANGKTIYIIDLRQENHEIINGYPVSFYSEHNWENKGLSIEDINKKQNELFSDLTNKEMTIYLKGDDEKASEDYLSFKINEYTSEKQLVESKGFKYINIPCVDHVWPSAENIDQFIEFVKSVDMKNVWLHFHCVAGEGRTATFMCLYDMMKNPQVSMKDICYRQTKLGGNYPLYIQEKDDWKKQLYEEKANMFPLLYQYIQENYQSNYEVTWSEWLNNNMPAS